jgi:hypothetical protein
MTDAIHRRERHQAGMWLAITLGSQDRKPSGIKDSLDFTFRHHQSTLFPISFRACGQTR